MTRSIVAGGLVALGLFVATTSSIAHAQSVNQNNQGQNNDRQGQGNGRFGPPPLSATPELDSSILFGVGLFGLAAASSVARRIKRRGHPHR